MGILGTKKVQGQSRTYAQNSENLCTLSPQKNISKDFICTGIEIFYIGILSVEIFFLGSLLLFYPDFSLINFL